MRRTMLEEVVFPKGHKCLVKGCQKDVMLVSFLLKSDEKGICAELGSQRFACFDHLLVLSYLPDDFASSTVPFSPAPPGVSP